MEPSITKDIYDLVTNHIIQKLEEGVIPWKQPWLKGGPPRNHITQRPYRGVNFLLLNTFGYAENEFLTFKQVKDLGASIKKGEKAHPVILWVWVDEEQNGELTGKKKPILRYYHVFNVSQCTNIPKREGYIPTKHNDPIELCEHIVEGMPNKPKIVHNENEAYYNSYADFINMPKLQTFVSSEAYYATLFHELIHATGYEARLNRKELMNHTTFGSDMYSIEELTAEIGACYLTSYADITQNGLINHIAYIHGWLKKLKEDKKFIVYASIQAQKATDYILGIQYRDKESITEPQEA